jgi:hypothetical protein
MESQGEGRSIVSASEEPNHHPSARFIGVPISLPQKFRPSNKSAPTGKG